MRLSTHYMYKCSIESMSNATNNYNDINMRLSARQTLLKPSDDPASASQAVAYQNALSDLNQYDTARMYARNALGHEDTVLNSISSLLTKNLSEKIVQAGNETYSDADRQALATELEGIRDSLLDFANSKDSNGRYIFGGYKTGSEPFSKDGTYVGGDSAMIQKVGDSTQMQVGHIGSDIFMSGSDDDLFAALDNAIDALKQPIDGDEDREALKQVLDNAHRSINKGIDNLGKVQATVGTNLQRLDELDSSSEINKIAVKSSYEQTIGADGDSTITLINKWAMTEFSLNASMMVFQAMSKMSIFNML